MEGRKRKLIYVDIDETICETVTIGNYRNSKPIYENIEKINKLHEEGHIIVYWSARGGNTGINWEDFTKKQLDSWGCQYDDIIMNNKPPYDLLICDKSIRIEEL